MIAARIDLREQITQRTVLRYMPILEDVYKSGRIKGVLFVINSPGGEANSSQILANTVSKLAEKKKVYCIVEGMAASGAYWIASSCSRIFAMDTSLVGSIGIIGVVPRVTKLLEKLGVRIDVSKIGSMKDMNSPFSEGSVQETAAYNELLSDVFQKFKDDVVSRRHIAESEIPKVINGAIFSAPKAKLHGLIDEIGDVYTALDSMQKELNAKLKVRGYEVRRSLVSRMLSADLMWRPIRSLLEESFGISDEFPQLLFRP